MEDMGNVIPFVPHVPGKKPVKFKKGSPEALAHMRNITKIRMDKIASGELAPNGRKLTGTGAGRLKPITNQEVRAKALQTAADLFDDARQRAVDKLVDQIDSKDPGVAQKAAIKVLEYTDGKPNQPVTARTDNVTKVIYETAAIASVVFLPGFGLDDEDVA